jgi:hypothetical protein
MSGHAFAFNQAWRVLVAIAADLLAWPRLLVLAGNPVLRRATAAVLRALVLNVPGRAVNHSRKRIIRVDDDHPHHAYLTQAWKRIQGLGVTPP